ncbi:EamA family transporter, partial [Microbacterium sp.]|uniref:EamA family transporter n=1 Tax=Microbacterium sp. TaxID=51671 RepID=UPI003C72895C
GHSTGPLAPRGAWLLAVACGFVDATANLLLLLALRAGGDLAIVAALTAMYPAGTVLLAAVVLRERIAAVQWVGLALALTAGIMLATG